MLETEKLIMNFSAALRRRAWLGFFALGVAGFASAQTTVVSTLSPPLIGGSDGITMNNWRANQFTTGSALTGYDLYSATLQMSVATIDQGNFFVGVYTNSNNIITGDTPGLQLGINLIGTSSPGSAGQNTYIASSIHLDPNTSYWLVEGVMPITLSMYNVNFESINPVVTDVWTLTGKSSYTGNNGLTWGFSVTGTIGMMSLQMVNVPEPAEFGLVAGVAGLAGCVVARRRKLRQKA